MRRLWLGVLALAALCAGAAPARADAPLPEEDPETFTHAGQFGVSLQAGFGYRGVFPYDEEYCGDLEDDGSFKAHCLGRSPFALDLAVSYGVIDFLELFLELRVGLERDVGEAPMQDGPRILALSPGIKGYIAEVGAMRLFSTLQAQLDFTDYGQFDESYGLGVRQINGLQLDLHRTVGLYVYFGETVSWTRWLRFEVESGLGIQARFP